MPVHLVTHLEAADFAAETLRIGDLNRDGAPDLLLAQSVFGTREITCLTAITISGQLLWQWGKPSIENARIYSDLPVQIYDWDDDGRNEVLFVRQAVYAEPQLTSGYARERTTRYEGEARMIVLDAATGREKSSFSLPAPADDCFLLADLTGRGRREDLIVKDRYWNMWGIAHDGRVLWHYKGSVGHFPAIGDVDNDGRDEVFVGFALIDHDGKVLFQHDAANQHQDAACIVRMPDGSCRLVFGNGGLHCLDTSGRELWSHPLAEAQHVVPGRFGADSATQLMVINRGQPRPTGGRDPAMLALYDMDGREIWRRVQPEGSWASGVTLIEWEGQGNSQCALVYSRGYGQPAAIYNGEGEIVDELAYKPAVLQKDPDWITKIYGPPDYYGVTADVWGDGRDEAILFGAPGLYIYANARPLALPSLYNETLYPGM